MGGGAGGLPAVEVDGAGNDGIRQFGENGTSHKGNPGVDLGIGFAGLIKAPEMKEPWL